jgi:hypothetical protein
MIRKNPINCKLIREKRAGKIIFQGYMDHLRPGSEVCPLCGCRGEMRVHAYYDRSRIEFIDGRPVKVSLCICRLICRQCKRPSSHAVLPDPVIPYSRHSLFFILRVLAEHALRLRSVEPICEIFDISLKTFFRWQKFFEEHRREWQGLLTSIETDLKAAMLELVRKDPFSAFAFFFFRLTGLSLLQSHKNPSRSPRKAGSSDSDFP